MIRWLFTSFALAGFVSITAPPAAADGPGALIEIHLGNSRPPAPRREVRPHYPGRGYVWVDGAWDWQGGQWVWIDGRWEQPAQHVYWVRARYAPEYGHWRYVPGHWSNQQVQEGEDYRTWKASRHTDHDGHHDDGHHDNGHDGHHDNGHGN